METTKIKYDITNNKVNNLSKEEKAEKTLLYTISDILACAGVLKYMIFEDYRMHKEAFRNIKPGVRVKSFDDLKKKLDKGINTINEVVETLEIRNMYNSGVYKAQDIHYGLYSVIKSLTRMSEPEIYNIASQLTNDTTSGNFQMTNRLDFIRFLDTVMQKASKSNHDAIEYVKKFHKAMVVDVDDTYINTTSEGNTVFKDTVIQEG